MAEVEGILKNRTNVVGSIEALQKENAALQKQRDNLLREKAGSLKDKLLAKARVFGDITLIAEKIELDPKAVKDLAFELKSQEDNLFLVLANQFGGKVMLTVALSKVLIEGNNLHAGKIVKELAAEIGGGGGGQAEFATAGGKNANGIPNALSKAEQFLN